MIASIIILVFIIIEVGIVWHIDNRLARIEARLNEMSDTVATIDTMKNLIDENMDKIAYLQGKLGTLTDRAATAHQDIGYLMMVTGELKNKA